MGWQCPCWPTPLGEAPEVLRLEKIKTIGDAFMVAGGLPEPRRPDHAEAVACDLGEPTLLEGPLPNRLGASLDHLGRLEELGLLGQGAQGAGPDLLVGLGVQLAGPCQVVAAGGQQLPVQAFQAAEEDQHPEQEQAEVEQQANRVGDADGQDGREPGRVHPERGEGQPPGLTQAEAEVLGKGGERQGSPAQPVQATSKAR